MKPLQTHLKSGKHSNGQDSGTESRPASCGRERAPPRDTGWKPWDTHQGLAFKPCCYCGPIPRCSVPSAPKDLDPVTAPTGNCPGVHGDRQMNKRDTFAAQCRKGAHVVTTGTTSHTCSRQRTTGRAPASTYTTCTPSHSGLRCGAVVVAQRVTTGA